MVELESLSTPAEQYEATIVIVTKNRKQELRQAIESALQQQGRVEVLVIDDASTDGTAEMVRTEFPIVRFQRVEQSQGYIVHRNWAARHARSPVLFSIDDDAAFSSPDTVQHVLAEFNCPCVGAVAIPSCDVNKPGKPFYWPPALDEAAIWLVDAYHGTAHALRRDLFCKIGGYRTLFFHQVEESDYCLRLLNAGFITRLSSASPIRHYESPKRDRSRMFTYNARNNILFAWYNVPLPNLFIHLPATLIKSILHGRRFGYTLSSFRGAFLGLGMALKQFRHRRPVSRRVYRLSRFLRKHAPTTLEAIEHRLPGVVETPERPE